MPFSMKPRRRSASIPAFALLAALILALLVVLVLGAANAPWGRRAIEGAVARLTGEQVLIVGLAGNFPDELRAVHLELRDDRGTWLTADDVHVIWSPRQLLHDVIHLDLVEALRVQIARERHAGSPAREGAYAGLPRVAADRIALARVELGAPLAGAAAIVSIQGNIGLDWPREGAIDLRVLRTDAPGTYTVKARIDPAQIEADIDAEEPVHGLLAGLADLGDIGAVSGQLHVQGTRAAPSVQTTLSAGALRARASGSVDWQAQVLDLDVTGSAPAMALRPDLHWQSATLQAHVHGSMHRPATTAQLRIGDLSAGGTKLRSLIVDVQGKGGTVAAHMVAEQLRLPGPAPDLLRGAPLDVRANVDLGVPGYPASFTLEHPVLSVQGQGHLDRGIQAAFTVTVPQIAPFSALARTDLKGHAVLTTTLAQQKGAASVAVTGTVDLAGGSARLQGLLGSRAKLDIALAVKAHEIDVLRARIDAQNLQASIAGVSAAGKADFHWHAAIARLAALAPDLVGDVDLDGHLEQGPESALKGAGDTLHLAIDARGRIGTRRLASRRIEASMRLLSLRGALTGTIEAHGSFADAPAVLAATLTRGPGGEVQLGIERADWKSLHAQGAMALPSDAVLPQGRLRLQVSRLSDLAPWIDPGLEGSALASLQLAPAPTGHAQASIEADLRDLTLAGGRADHLHVAATIDDPAGQAALSGELSLDGIAAQGVRGTAHLGVKGRLAALKLDLVCDLHGPADEPAHVVAAGVFDAAARRLALGTLQSQWGADRLNLLAPANIDFRDGLAVDKLRVGVAGSVLEVAGRLAPVLDLTASLRDDAAAPRRAQSASGAGAGRGLAVDARLTGKLAQSALVEARISYGGQAQLTASGTLPFSDSAPMDLHAKGAIDAAIANSFLAARGRRLHGQVALDLGIGGTLQAPKVLGSLRMTEGSFEDDNLGAHLTRIEALVHGSSTVLQIARLTAKAGPGTLSLMGSVGLPASDVPVNVHLSARNAQPMTSDFAVVNLDADIDVRGTAPARLDAAGTIKINRADVNIPNALPPTVGVLDVRRPGQAHAPGAAAPNSVIGLDLKVDAPDAVFVRGRGIEAELGGTLRIAGTSADPLISGGFDLRRGTLGLAGSTLTFTSGRVGFNGTGVERKIDPTLDFEAQSQSASFTAKLDISGYVDAPSISVSSTPAMPQDEILAQLLFGTSVNKLSSLQMVQIGSAFATIGGLSSTGAGVLSTLQKNLGLDRLSVGNTPAGATSVEAGRYVTKGVFVGARQMGAAGGTTQALVQIDITKQLKAVGAFGNGGTVQGATPDNDPGNSIGLLYQVEF